MEKTLCELFAGVGGFRCGLNNINYISDINKPEKWRTVWFNQWEPAEKNSQWAHSCYVDKFGDSPDTNGNYTTNCDISTVNKKSIPNHNLLVGGFPCQDYSVASTLVSSKGLEGKKGVLWWAIRDILEEKKTPFVILENVDRLLKSPAKQRGRDFGIILACFRDLGYSVEWRVINAAEYGYQQRRRRTFIFAYRNDTDYAHRQQKKQDKIIDSTGFFANAFPAKRINNVTEIELFKSIGDISSKFHFDFMNSGYMHNGIIFTCKTEPIYNGKQKTMGDIIESKEIDSKYFIPEKKLYWTTPKVTRIDESKCLLTKEQKLTWQYIKGGKTLPRKAANGHEYIYSEGPIPMIDTYDKPARTMLTSEGTFNRSTHIITDRKTGKIRLLTAIETERIQGFPDNWTKECLINGQKVEMPLNKRRFMMGNALVVDLIKQMEPYISDIFEHEN